MTILILQVALQLFLMPLYCNANSCLHSTLFTDAKLVVTQTVIFCHIYEFLRMHKSVVMFNSLCLCHQ